MVNRYGLALLAATMSATLMAQAANPRFGKWKLKQDAPPPAINIMTYEPAGSGGMKVTVDAVNRNGEKTHWTYTTMFDGKDAPITGYATADTAAVTSVDAATNEIVYKKDGKVAQTATNVISPDGKTITVTFHRKNAEGKDVTTTAIYERQ